MQDLKELVEKSCTEDFIISLYSEIKNKKKMFNDKIIGSCCLHEDKNPSFNFDPKQLGLYKCFSCGATGNLYTYIKEVKKHNKPLIYLADKLGIKLEDKKEEYIPEEPEQKKPDYVDKVKNIVPSNEILKYKKRLLITDKDRLEYLNSNGIKSEIAKNYNLGWDGKCYWIPIKDEEGDFVNVRKYDPYKKTGVKFKSYKSGYGVDRLWPIQVINEDTIYIMEGEKDTLVALSLGLNAITNTAGATSWNANWGKLFKGKNVVICMDIDKPGKVGAVKRANNILSYAAQVKIVFLPLSEDKYPHGDFTDFMQENKLDDFIKLVNDTDAYHENDESDEYNLILAEASKNRYITKKCSIQNVLCCGKDSSPFAAPAHLTVKCTGVKTEKKCSLCSLFEKDYETRIQKDDPILITLVKITSEQVNKYLKEYLNIPAKCYSAAIEAQAYYNIESVRLVPEITYNIEEEYEHVYRTAYYVFDKGNFITTNKCYDIKALTTLDSKNQYIVHQVYDVKDSNSSIDSFEITNETIKRLNRFKVTTSIADKLSEIYEEYSKMSRIYGREDIFLLFDLAFHSALTFNFQGKKIGKGWVEVAVIGDSGVGKSTQAKFLCQHYKAGEFISGESANYTGLLGGLSQQGGAWQLQWGRLPLNDRRLCVIDETTGLKEEEIAKLSEIRSSGEAKIQKIVTENTRARTRLIWLANPRKSNLGIRSYPYGVTTVKEVFGMPEDVRRLDFASVVISGEISSDVINKDPEPIIPQYDSDICRDLIMFAWSRKSTDIIITKEAERAVLDYSIDLSKKYHSAIPLIEPADTRNKIIRGAVALAIRLFNVDENLKVIVDVEHVDYIVKFINKLYSARKFGYLAFSQMEFKKNILENKKEVGKILNLCDPFNIDELLSSSTINKSALTDIVEESLLSGDTKKSIRRLRKNNAIKEYSNYYVLQPGLLNFLRDLKHHIDDGGDYYSYFSQNDIDLEGGESLD